MHLCDCEQLQFVSEHLAEVDIERTDRGDALRIDVLQIDMCAESEIHKNRKLVCCIDTADIKRRICLRVAGALRFGQHIGERALLLGHLGQNVVGSSVDDSIDRKDSICSQSLFQSLDDWNAAANARLITDRDSRSSRSLIDF